MPRSANRQSPFTRHLLWKDAQDAPHAVTGHGLEQLQCTAVPAEQPARRPDRIPPGPAPETARHPCGAELPLGPVESTGVYRGPLVLMGRRRRISCKTEPSTRAHQMAMWAAPRMSQTPKMSVAKWVSGRVMLRMGSPLDIPGPRHRGKGRTAGRWPRGQAHKTYRCGGWRRRSLAMQRSLGRSCTRTHHVV